MLGQHGEPERSQILEMLRLLIENTEEVFVASETASSNDEFARLGLTDAALLEAVTGDTPLLTVDLNLYLAALTLSTQEITAVNFTHLRDL